MSVDREQFLGTTDVKVSSNLLRSLATVTSNNSQRDTKIVQRVELHGRVLIEIAELFSERECETIIANLKSHEERFESMQAKYESNANLEESNGDMMRNNARLVVMDGSLAASIEDRLMPLETHTLLPTTRPLGFGVAGNTELTCDGNRSFFFFFNADDLGDWELTGVNPAMRINRYAQGTYFFLSLLCCPSQPQLQVTIFFLTKMPSTVRMATNVPS